MKQPQERPAQTRLSVPRRRFLGGAAGAVAGLTLVRPESVRGSMANDGIRVGVIGCGGRGNYVSKIFREKTAMRLVAFHDPFPERAEELKRRYGSEGATMHKGMDGYKDIVASGKVDAVIITSPPFYHPEQTAAAVAQGKHVWLAKPVCVDVAGGRSIIESGKKAGDKTTVFVDFQTRNSPAFQGAAERVHGGAIGDIVSGQVFYHARRLGVKADPKDSSPAARLKNWVFDKILSGDIIVEQNVHVLDVANWYIGTHPVKAFGAGGRKARTDVGDCWDHFIVTYWYPDCIIDFSSGQYLKGFVDLCIRLYGTQGTVDSHYGGKIGIAGDKPWEGTERDNTYYDPVVRNAVEFEKAILSGKPVNNTRESTHSTLTGVLGRMAAYEGRTVTWNEMMSSNQKLEAELKL